MPSALVTIPPMPGKPLPPSKKRLQVGARLEPSLVDALEAMSVAEDRTVSKLIELAVREFIERRTIAAPKTKAAAAKGQGRP